MTRKAGQTTAVPPTADPQPAISVIVPTRNEADNIRPLLARIAAATRGLAVEALFVDDSTDDTAVTIARLAPECDVPVRVLARPPAERDGLSGAVVAGLRAAAGDWVCVMDADLQHPPETIPQLWEQAQKTGADMVVGSRRGDVIGPLGLSRMRSLTSKSLTILARMLFPRLLKNVSDPLTGLFLVRKTAVDVDALRPDGFKILLEILIRCPDLYVSEIHFDFAPRHEGQSKADFQEGMRFFRQLVRLRVTVNPHLVRFAATAVSGILVNIVLLALLLRGGLRPLVAGVLVAEVLWIWMFVWSERWVFRERAQAGAGRRFWADFAVTQLVLALIYLPLMWLLAGRLGVPVQLANLGGILLVSLVRYGLSEQWIWHRRSMVWQQETTYYNLHDLLTLESQVPLDDLAHFAVAQRPEQIDVHVRVDRQGTPSAVPGGISYDERMGRFGFGLTVLPGDYTEIVVSPLLDSSRAFLFTNVIEPVLRWRLVRKGAVLASAAAVARDGRALLVAGRADMGPDLGRLCVAHAYRFLSDDKVIVARDGTVYSYPKPVTIGPRAVDGRGSRLRTRARLGVFGQRLLYSQGVRRLGLWLSRHELPAATLNTYLQRAIPQPKYPLDRVVAGVRLGERARVRALWLAGGGGEALDTAVAATRLLPQDTTAGFQPNPLLAEKLSQWQGRDLRREEHAILTDALRGCAIRPLQDGGGEWWQQMTAVAAADRTIATLALAGGREKPGVS